MKKLSLLFVTVITLLASACTQPAAQCTDCVTKAQMQKAIDSALLVKPKPSVVQSAVQVKDPVVIKYNPVEPEDSQEYLILAKTLYAKLHSMPRSKTWRADGTIGTKMFQSGNRLYEYFVDPLSKIDSSTTIFLRSTPLNGDFPRKVMVFTYHHNKNIGYLEDRDYKKAGQGSPVSDADSAKNDFDTMLAKAKLK